MKILFLALATVGAAWLYRSQFFLDNTEKAASLGLNFGVPLLLFAVGLGGYFLVKNR